MFDMVMFKRNVVDFFTNPVILCAALSWIVAQLIKLITTPCYKKDFSVLHTLFGTGGMPSSHAAAVCATAISCGILYGYNSAIFAVAGVLAMIVMRDAVGIRREAGKQAGVINQITEEINKKKRFIDVTLPELLGHTPLQVLFGALLGVAMAYFCQRFLFLKIF
ncbi:MAG: divergent PAP2 family protein [Ruminococcaceae bacterium]|nr:divergent PAP2 family protein [Oscillospiraceae bacterium]